MRNCIDWTNQFRSLTWENAEKKQKNVFGVVIQNENKAKIFGYCCHRQHFDSIFNIMPAIQIHNSNGKWHYFSVFMCVRSFVCLFLFVFLCMFATSPFGVSWSSGDSGSQHNSCCGNCCSFVCIILNICVCVCRPSIIILNTKQRTSR